MKQLNPKHLRLAISDLLELIGDENGIVYVDGEPKLKIRRYDVTQAKTEVSKATDSGNYVVTQARYVPPKAGDTVYIKGRPVVVPELDAEGRVLPEYGF